MRKISIDETKCTKCQKCARECGLDIITASDGEFPQIHDPGGCFGCGHCVAVCPSAGMIHSDFPYQELIKAQPGVVNGDDAETMLLSRRSCRAYKPDLPERSDLERLFRVATMASTAFNCEDRGFVFVTDPKVLGALRTGLVDVTKRNIKLLSVFITKPLSFLLPAETIEHFKRMIFDFNRYHYIGAPEDNLSANGI